MNKNWIIFICLLAVFLAFFIQFPLQNSLTGNLDGIANLAMYKQMKLHIDSWITASNFGSICYPIKHPGIYFGADYGLGILHIFFNYLGLSDIWANWLFISLVFTINSFALFLLIEILVKDKKIAIAASLLFHLSHFMLANLENPNVLFFGFFFFSIYFYKKYLITKGENNVLLLKAAVLGCFQVYLSPYLFLLHTFVWAMLILFHEPRLFSKQFILKYAVIGCIYIIVTSPYLYYFVFNEGIDESRNTFFLEDVTYALSLNLRDLLQVLPNHLYLKHKIIYESPFLSQIKSAYIGIIFYAIAFYGCLKTKNKITWITISIVGLIIAIGPYIVLSPHQKWPFIMYPFYEYLDFRDILRMPFRAFFITLLGLTIMAAYGLKYLKDRYAKFPFWLLITGLVLLENIPLKMEVYDQQKLLHPDEKYIDYLSAKHNAIVLNLPSALGLYEGDRNEYIYAYWQYFHRQTILNGNLAFFPDERIKTDDITRSINSNGLKTLIKRNKITTIAFHKDLKNEVSLTNELDSLLSFPFLMQSLESDRVVIFEVTNL